MCGEVVFSGLCLLLMWMLFSMEAVQTGIVFRVADVDPDADAVAVVAVVVAVVVVVVVVVAAVAVDADATAVWMHMLVTNTRKCLETDKQSNSIFGCYGFC